MLKESVVPTAVLRAAGGVCHGMVNGAGSLLSGMRSATASWVRAMRSAGSTKAALLNRPTLRRSRRLSCIGSLSRVFGAGRGGRFGGGDGRRRKVADVLGAFAARTTQLCGAGTRGRGCRNYAPRGRPHDRRDVRPPSSASAWRQVVAGGGGAGCAFAAVGRRRKALLESGVLRR